jgi:uncharacterized protein (TIGR00299 family) protein
MTRAGVIAVIDSQLAGISGDMLLSSLVDAGANKDKVVNSIFACQDFLKGSTITKASFAKTVSHGFSATEFQFSYKDRVNERRGIDMYRSLALCCDSLGLEQRSKTFALESMKTIIAAESIIHGEEYSRVHLHEASSIDTMADLVGCATALQDLGLFESKIFSTAVAVGGGFVKFSHGKIPNPASAILEIFKGKKFTLIGGQAERELTTPTGAAMLVNLASGSVKFYPSLSPEKIGYGAGQAKTPGMPNVLRIVVGRSDLVAEANRDTVCIIETNIDDVTGEIIGNLIERLEAAGAKDVTVTSAISKKNRPAYLIKIISDNADLHGMLQVLFEESGTLGVRVQEVERFVLPRAIMIMPVDVCNIRFNVHTKIVRDSHGALLSAKPEFEDIKIIASRTGMPVKRVLEIVSAHITDRVGRLYADPRNSKKAMMRSRNQGKAE